jgi:hypothetical protein
MEKALGYQGYVAVRLENGNYGIKRNNKGSALLAIYKRLEGEYEIVESNYIIAEKVLNYFRKILPSR